jgi:hypothetical protein
MPASKPRRALSAVQELPESPTPSTMTMKTLDVEADLKTQQNISISSFRDDDEHRHGL